MTLTIEANEKKNEDYSLILSFILLFIFMHSKLITDVFA